MMNIGKKISQAAFALAFTCVSLAFIPLAMANTVSVTTSVFVGAPYTQTGKLAQKVGSNTGFYDAKWGPSATSVWTTLDANGDIGNQGIGNSDLTDWIKDTTGYSGSLTLVSHLDNLSGSTGSYSFGSKLANYVAVHYGQAESLFYFANGISQFDLSFIEGNFGLSNYRAYGSNTPPTVPLPAAAPLLLSGLGVLGFATRRRKIKTEAA